MKILKGRIIISYIVAVSLMVVLHSSAGMSAEVIEDEIEVEVTGSGSGYYDYLLPEDSTATQLNLAVRGADGGRRYYDDGMLTYAFYAPGGSGALVAGSVPIGDDGIPLGSTIRLIPGERGSSANSFFVEGSGGGGGSGILFKGPDDDEWTVLIAAGGGGGAASGIIKTNSRYFGGHASADDCDDGSGGVSGGYSGRFSDQYGGGGGADEDAVCSDYCSGVIGGLKGMSEGGVGGKSGNRGGFGFGGGGHSKNILQPGGGGGGYCGGDAGDTQNGAVTAGKGGGSYMNPDFGEALVRTVDGYRVHPRQGYAKLLATSFPPPPASAFPLRSPPSDPGPVVSVSISPMDFRSLVVKTCGSASSTPIPKPSFL